MATTYEKIATTTLSSTSATITFSSIAASWTDLKLVFVGTANTAALANRITFNGDTASNYSWTVLSGNGTAASSTRYTAQLRLETAENSSLSTTIPKMFMMDIFSYAGSTFKTALTSNAYDANGSGASEAFVGLWRSTSAITSITLTTSTNLYAVGTTATLYGIKAA